jgi:nucleoside-diphosphate-sugar epimerase
MIFLLRPPHIVAIEGVYRPLLNSAEEHGIRKVIFLSVQGAEKSKVIPHNKIEHLIQDLNFNYIFVRPSYFMQNLTTVLFSEIVNQKSITLPSNNAKFNWIDVKNIGEATAKLILDFDNFHNQAYEITGSENVNFEEVAQMISEITKQKITYRSLNPICFYLRKRKEGLERSFALVMCILHFLPRFQKDPEISNNYKLFTNKNPTTLKEFIQREKWSE